MSTFQLDDGGRAAAGYSGTAGDCVVRAIAIAAQLPYQKVYDDLFALNRATNKKKDRCSPRDGNTSMKTIKQYLEGMGWRWKPTMQIGSGCTVHLRADELPKGRLIVRASRHLVAVVDGVIHDTYDSSRGGTRCVYGYFVPYAVSPQRG